MRRNRLLGVSVAEISIHAPLAGCDHYSTTFANNTWISIHAPLAGCDGVKQIQVYCASDFNPRTPCGVRLVSSLSVAACATFQSTHPLRGATVYQQDAQAHDPISIHAPLAGCDFTIRNLSQTEDISIHAPLAGCDFFVRKEHFMSIFQSTHPLRGATYPRPPWPGGRHFNPRTPCGVRPHAMGEGLRISPISIHAPLAGCDAVMADEP